MFLKADWDKYLHKIREAEIKKVFGYFNNENFSKGLEVGCGDGYQTVFISKHCDQFVSGDLNFNRIKRDLKVPSVAYKQFDADKLDNVFLPQEFDLVFSSNVLEHLGDPKGFLKNTHLFLKERGYAVHIVPARPVKISYLILHYLNLFILVLDRLVGIFRGKKVFRGGSINAENNINKLEDKAVQRSKFVRIFFPQIHGNYKSHSEEYVKFGKKRWEELFNETGYKVVKYIKGPVFSGYGFGWDWMRNILERVGWSSEHIFILKKDTLMNFSSPTPTVAVLIPTKNRQKLLERALKSVFRQRISADEIIVVNDGSEDDTKEFLERIAPQHLNLKVINREKSGGVNAARNQGTKEAKSDWIAWLDDDDEFLPDAVETMKKRLQSIPPEIEVAYFNTQILKSEGAFEGGYNLADNEEFKDLNYEDVMQIKNKLKGDCKSVIRRSLFVEGGYWLPESVNGFESYFFNIVARDGKGVRCYRDVCTKIHQENELSDRLSINASRKNPWPLFVLHLKQLCQHWRFYITHPGITARKKLDMAKLLVRVISRI